MATHQVALVNTEEGWAVWCPALPGCASQGETEQEALENIKDAIRMWLEVHLENRLASFKGASVTLREVQVA
jgi:predicted RNase H-like HicB family nuclease